MLIVKADRINTVSAHMLYENSDFVRLYEPGGYLDVSDATYEQLDDSAVWIEGAVWSVAGDHTVKLEGARVVGCQTILIALLRDPHHVAHADAWARDIEALATQTAALRTGVACEHVQLEICLIGTN